jgi:hypothetical protein
MKNKQQALNILAEIQDWNNGDWHSYVNYGEVPFDGTFVFRSRQKKIQELEKILLTLVSE